MIQSLHRSAILLVTLALCAGAADTARQIAWKDLQPAAADNPFAKLSRAQLLSLADLAELRERRARGEKISAIDAQDEQAALRRLQNEGVDADALLAKRKEIAAAGKARATAVNRQLDGQLVRMPGYLLPLEFSGKEVTEFLLVPWIGACIHTPPPAPNQIVHVRADSPVKDAAYFSPIWVTGRLSHSGAKHSIYLTDGKGDVDVAYAMRASKVELIKDE
jgi:hypothetical protein